MTSKNIEISNDRNQANWSSISDLLLSQLCANTETGNETILLTSHAFLSLQRAHLSPENFASFLNDLLNLNTCTPKDVKLFELILCNGILQLGNCQPHLYPIYTRIFEILHSHCKIYTNYSYLAFKILQTWMKRTAKSEFWSNCPEALEEALEEVVFSNWDNSISKQSVASIFRSYLDIVETKYKGYAVCLLGKCIDEIPWNHVNKFHILAELCAAISNVRILTDRSFITNLIESLEDTSLRTAASKVYFIVSEKLNEDQWREAFAGQVMAYVEKWEKT